VEQDRLDEFSALMTNASKSITKLKNKYMSSYGLSSAHTMCIRKLNSSPNGLTRTQIAKKCELDKSQISRIISELSEKGYVLEGPECSNYKKRVMLTDEGKRIAADINSIALDINKYVSGKISTEDITTFYRVFGEICENLKRSENKC